MICETGPASLSAWHAVLGSMDAGIIVQDLDGKVTMMNRAAKTMLGSRRSLRDGELRTLFERYRSVRRTRAALLPLGDSDELMLNHRILRAHLVAVGDDQDERIGTVIILRDITYDALARRLKDGFVSRIAQEMEAPLSLMKLAGDLLNGEPDDAAFNRHLLQKLLANVELLDRLLLELLDVAALNAGNLDVAREPLNIESWVWSVVNGISADIATSGIDLLVMTRGISDLQIKGDEQRLQWALGHIIRNGRAIQSRRRIRGNLVSGQFYCWQSLTLQSASATTETASARRTCRISSSASIAEKR